MHPVTRVVVVGAGISGLAAAWELSGGAEPAPDAPEVTVLEASARLGGPLHTVALDGQEVDAGPDGFLGRRPEAVGLCAELGLQDALRPVGARGASVWARGRLRALPEGLALGVPTRFWPVARSGVLGPRGQLGLARDVLFPRPDRRGPIGDRSIGPLVARKLGRRCVDVLVDPLIGGIHAGSVDDMSAAAVYPPLLAAAQRRGSLMRALRAEVAAPDPDAPPLFWALEGGMSTLVSTLADALRGRGVTISTGAGAHTLERAASRWRVRAPSTEVEADAVVLAVPAPEAAALLRPHDDEVSALLDAIDYAGVTVVTLRVGEDTIGVPGHGTGFLVPSREPAAAGVDGWSVTACTYLSQKWPHLARPGEVLLRASLGRQGDARAEEWDDEEIVDRVLEDLSALIGLDGDPVTAVVTRWPAAFPQYRVHHLLRVAGVEAALSRLGRLAVAGAAYRGVGIPACIASGRAAARTVS